ncbi:BTB/POZ and MATH domain-containing protein 3-like [Ananas comosus]|uniref:BTB/POZ and MATH domain-containing protein 3 n=1 Tax=Ananas comosus TaxID=4615 RepID=A0A199W226_ANACO|nr:BTB/POZ and MATH domain-containing protein 3-like [Ananas comosus]OAY83517.1 BTB/POZ and MATH domain-containing protein 3 [Ananas comosus]
MAKLAEDDDNGGDSGSRSVFETVSGSHRYAVKGFSLAKGMGPGRFLSSGAFAVGGHEWAVYVYPDGKSPEDGAAYVSAFVALASEGTDVRALFELALVDQSGKGKHKVHSHFARALDAGPYTLKYRGSMWGYKRFYRRTSLETSDYLKDDCIILNCTVGVVRNRVNSPKHLSISVPSPDLGHCLMDLLKSGIGSDIVFEVGDEMFRAHKLVLATRSPVFNAQFFGPIGNRHLNRVVVEDVEPLVFKAMLHFIYSDKFPSVHELTGPDSICTSTIMVQHILVAADRYGLERLRLLCEAKLCEELTTDTVVTTLALADQHQCAQLKSACLKFMAARENLGVVMETEAFDHLKETSPLLLSDLLATVANADNDPTSIGQKRSSSSVVGLDLRDPVELFGRRIRQRL